MVGCLLLHGFQGAPYEIEPLADALAKRRWQISTPTYPGYAAEQDGAKRVTWKDWMQKAEQELSELLSICSIVYVIGFSMGGLIAAYLSTKYRIDKIVLLNPCVYYANPSRLFQTVAEEIKSNFMADADHIKRRVEKTHAYQIRSVVHLRRLIQIVKPELSKVTAPALIIQGERDERVDPRSGRYILDNIQSPIKEAHFFPNARHLICHGNEKDRVIALVNRFLTERAPVETTAGRQR